MALNVVFIAFFLIAFAVALVQYLMGNGDVFSSIIQSTFDNSKLGFELSIGLTGSLAMWMGIMKIGENGGAVRVLSRLVAPFFNRLFPEVPKGHTVFGSIMMNFSANMLGLDNAATPMGLKAMGELQELNPSKEKASNAQIMFLVLNTSGLTLIPVSILTLRAQHFNIQSDAFTGVPLGSFPTDVFIPILIATFCSSLFGIIIVSIKQKINLFQGVILGYIGVAIALIAGLIYYFNGLTPKEVGEQSALISGFVLLSIIIVFISLGIRSKVNVYESFVDGAKEGFGTAIKIIPYLVGILVAIGVFRACGAMDLLIQGIKYVVLKFTDSADFVEALPTAIMKPLSGSGARAMMVETMNNYPLFVKDGVLVESFPSFLASTFQGTTETTFYVLAVYYGAVGIKNSRYTLGAGLLADLFGVIAAIFIGYLFYQY